MQPFHMTAELARQTIGHFMEFHTRSTTSWSKFTDEMKRLLTFETGLEPNARWSPRLLVACVCCSRMFWREEMEQLHLVGPQSDWIKKPAEVARMLSVKEYAQRMPRIPLAELQASSVLYQNEQVLLHK